MSPTKQAISVIVSEISVFFLILGAKYYISTGYTVLFTHHVRAECMHASNGPASA